MGHRLSKSNNNNNNTNSINNRHSNDISRLRNEENLNSNPSGPPLASQSRSSIIDIRTSVPPDSTTTITSSLSSSSSLPTENQNLHIESATITLPSSHTTTSSSSASSAAAAGRRFVIKIQLTKMEPGCNPGDSTASTVSTSVAIDTENGNSSENFDNNLNVARPILNLTFTKNIQCDSNDEIVIVSNEEIKLNNLNALSDRRIGGCVVNTNFISNFSPMTTVVGTDEDGNQILQSNNHNVSLRDGNPITNSACGIGGNGSVEAAVNVPENQLKFQNNSTTGIISTMCACNSEDDKDHCCKRKNSTSYPSKWRCCKCMCLHANMKDASQSEDGPSSSSSSTSSKGNWTSKLNCTRTENPPTENSADLAMWMPPENSTFLQIAPSARHPFKDIVLLALNCSPSLLVGPTEDCDERARRLRALEIETGFDPMSEIGSTLANVISGQKRCDHFLCSLCTPTFRHVVHSQVDYIHCLVPDLDKITNSSFYWGKMDRYEAERLLEGKPEGTFLLRDSAQEEYLFSVTFRKYGRSLHARIEQFNHKFSFDCHDPGVFTARTVTGLLEHYKDPSCVMFFEPMLTIPLHRNSTFSLQQLCRATIASNVTYDGINELQLPNMLKAYVKEYHYKLRVRVKPFDELYQCS